ncbi:MAG: McrC family protein [Alkalimonas sp.]|nr:McrC family protein [Alkalimonas sp.]
MLGPLAHQAGLILKEHKHRKNLAYRYDIGRSVFQMKPDICLLNEAGAVVEIFDAKWKMLAPEEAKLGVSQQDMYQVIAYSELYQTSKIGLIYPGFGEVVGAFQMTINSPRQVQLSIKTLDIASKASMSVTFLND